MTKRAACVCFALLVAGCEGERAMTFTGKILRAPTGDAAEWKTSTRVLDWPRFRPLNTSRYVSSFDREGGNNDGFTGRFSELYTDERGEHVIFDAFGPGALVTLWFTSSVDGKGPLELGRVRFYFDGETEPRIDIDSDELYRGTTEPFLAPLVVDNAVSTGGFASWTPIPYRSRLKITTEQKAGFYIAQYDTFAPNADVPSWTREVADETWRAMFDGALEEVSTLREIPLDYEGFGSGTIESLQFRPAGEVQSQTLQLARITIWFDGVDAPHVDAPLGAFFGSGLGPTRVESIPLSMTSSLFECRFPMPFWRSFRVRVTGIDGTLLIQVGGQRYRETEAGYFEAVARAEHPTTPGVDFEYVDLEGTGSLVGTVTTVEPIEPGAKQWWEGDLRSYSDDLRTPGLHGTGHEDDHLGGWSNEFFDGPFTLPMHGEPRTEILDRTGQYNANVTMYRLWPGIAFSSRVRHSVEHGSENGRPANYSSVTFLYRRPDARLVRTDAIDVGDDAARASHGYEVTGQAARASLTSTFEGRENHNSVTAEHESHSGEVVFRITIDPDNEGVKLRRQFDQLRARQQATVVVDGVTVGTFYSAESNAFSRWGERDYALPKEVTRGKRTLELRLVPVGDIPWNAARYEAWTVKGG